jgi:hypothetical protein
LAASGFTQDWWYFNFDAGPLERSFIKVISKSMPFSEAELFLSLGFPRKIRKGEGLAMLS